MTDFFFQLISFRIRTHAIKFMEMLVLVQSLKTQVGFSFSVIAPVLCLHGLLLGHARQVQRSNLHSFFNEHVNINYNLMII